MGLGGFRVGVGWVQLRERGWGCFGVSLEWVWSKCRVGATVAENKNQPAAPKRTHATHER